LFQSNTKIFYLSYWLQVSAITPSLGQHYMQFKTGQM